MWCRQVWCRVRLVQGNEGMVQNKVQGVVCRANVVQASVVRWVQWVRCRQRLGCEIV